MSTRKPTTRRLGASGRTSETKALYARAKKLFTAADLQKYSELLVGVPSAKTAKQMGALQRRPK